VPWHLSNNEPDCSGWAVVKDSDGKVVGCHPSRRKALAQLAALNANVKEAYMKNTDLYRALAPSSAGFELREAPDGGPTTLIGRFGPFNEWNEIDSWFEGRFLERVIPGAFVDSFERMTPKVTFNHGRDPDLGDKLLGYPVTVREDERSAIYEAPLLDGVPPLLVSGLRAGAYGSSFRFGVDEENIVERPERSDHNPEGLPERSIIKATVPEAGPVTFPAHANTTAGVRSLTDEFRPAAETVAEMARKRPADLARMIEEALKDAGVKPEPAPTPAEIVRRFRTREEWLEWLSRN